MHIHVGKTTGRNKAADKFAAEQGKTVTERRGPEFRMDAETNWYSLKLGKGGWAISAKKAM